MECSIIRAPAPPRLPQKYSGLGEAHGFLPSAQDFPAPPGQPEPPFLLTMLRCCYFQELSEPESAFHYATLGFLHQHFGPRAPWG